jgi:hypothetical protein
MSRPIDYTKYPSRFRDLAFHISENFEANGEPLFIPFETEKAAKSFRLEFNSFRGAVSRFIDACEEGSAELEEIHSKVEGASDLRHAVLRLQAEPCGIRIENRERQSEVLSLDKAIAALDKARHEKLRNEAGKVV